MKKKEMAEGRQALNNFTKAMKAIFRAPKTEHKKRGKQKNVPKH